MIERPRISSGMKRFRRSCGLDLLPSTRDIREAIRPRSVADRALDVAWRSFASDPYWPLGPEFLAWLRADGLRISPGMFRRVVEALREHGFIVGDQWHPDMLSHWESEWARCRRSRRRGVDRRPGSGGGPP